ncbi:MAG: hypothetical protein QOH47_351 [Sphingomonadales bacterium]|nr:hypothetical protein [Sphingomonadales bacterium]
MVTTVLLAGLLAQSAAPAAVPTCVLVAPNGDPIGFKLTPWDESGETMGLLATEGSVWPTATLVGDRMAAMPAGDAGRAFAFGGDRGIVVLLGDPEAGRGWQPVALFRRAGGRMSLPLAHGFCQPGPRFTVHRPYDPAADPAAIGDAIAAFDQALWPKDDCALLAQDGRRLRMRYRLRDSGTVEFQSTELWGREPLAATLTHERVQRGRPGRARFVRRTGPSGHELFFVDDTSGVKLITFLELRGTGARDQAGFAICGYRGMTRGPAPR